MTNANINHAIAKSMVLPHPFDELVDIKGDRISVLRQIASYIDKPELEKNNQLLPMCLHLLVLTEIKRQFASHQGVQGDMIDMSLIGEDNVEIIKESILQTMMDMERDARDASVTKTNLAKAVISICFLLLFKEKEGSENIYIMDPPDGFLRACSKFITPPKGGDS